MPGKLGRKMLFMGDATILHSFATIMGVSKEIIPELAFIKKSRWLLFVSLLKSQ